MAQQDYLYPKVPVRNSDGVISAVDQENFNRNIINLLKNKVSKDNKAVNVDLTSLIYDEILLEIEMMKVSTVLCDPLNISSKYLICDGSTIPSDSEAYIIHNTGGTVTKDSFSKAYSTVYGRSSIPDLLGYHLRYQDIGSAIDPDRATRRQLATGTVNTSSGVIVYFPKYYINIIKDAVDNSRTIVIANGSVGLFGTLAIYGTVSSVNTDLNYVVLTSVTGTFTAGSQSLIIQGDLIGSFQKDAMQRITGTINTINYQKDNTAVLRSLTGVFSDAGNVDTSTRKSTEDSTTTRNIRQTIFNSANSVSPNTAKTSEYETRGINAALLPLVRVYI